MDCKGIPHTLTIPWQKLHLDRWGYLELATSALSESTADGFKHGFLAISSERTSEFLFSVPPSFCFSPLTSSITTEDCFLALANLFQWCFVIPWIFPEIASFWQWTFGWCSSFKTWARFRKNIWIASGISWSRCRRSFGPKLFPGTWIGAYRWARLSFLSFHVFL